MTLKLWEVPACEKHNSTWHSDCDACRNLTQEEINRWNQIHGYPTGGTLTGDPGVIAP